MQIELLTHTAAGWSGPFPEMDSDSTMVVVFGASRYYEEPDAITELAAAFPNSHVVGCSTSGEIHGTQVNDDSLSVAVVRFDSTRIRSAVTQVSDDSYTAGRTLAGELAEEDLRSIFVLSEGLGVNGSELARGINENVSDQVIVTGGLAGDGADFERTWVLVDGKPAEGYVSTVGFYGDSIEIGHGSKGGWDYFGPERVVTRSEGSVLYELDGRPALELYKEYLGDLADGLPATGLLFPLALRSKADDPKQLVRTILAVDEDAQSLTFAGDVPEGHHAQLMQANFDRLVEGAEDAALFAKDLGGQAQLSIAISCVGRRLVLGEHTEEEVEAVLDVLAADIQQIGFYSYGELSPHTTGACDLHNQTMTLTTFSENG